jgi:aspartate racemase
MNQTHTPRRLGLIGGLGPGATIHYYQRIVELAARRSLVPNLVIAHADINRALALVRDDDRAGLADYLAGFAGDLRRAGAEFGAIAAVTPHICWPELAARAQLPLVSMLDETARAGAARGLRRVALFGTRFVIESKLFGALTGVDVVTPRPDEIDAIHKVYVEIVATGRGLPEHESGLRRLAHELCRRDGVEAIILAGTELSLVFHEGNTDFPAIDCAQIHIEALVQQMASRD